MRQIKIGDRVRIADLGRCGVVLNIRKGRIDVRYDNGTLRAHALQELRLEVSK